MLRRLALALLLAAPPALAPAAVFLDTSVEDVARDSEAVLEGRVMRKASHLSRDGRTIWTEVEIAVSAAWRGAPEDFVKLAVPGGRVGDLAQRVDAAPAFAEGERVVVFVTRRGAYWQLAGLALAKYRVEGGRAVPDLQEASFLPRALRAGERRVEAMALDELRARVRGVDR